MSGQPIDTDCMTLTRFILAEQKKHPEADGNLSQLLTSLQSAIKAISAAVRRAGISKLFGTQGSVNVQGEEQQKLDILANQVIIGPNHLPTSLIADHHRDNNKVYSFIWAIKELLFALSRH